MMERFGVGTERDGDTYLVSLAAQHVTDYLVFSSSAVVPDGGTSFGQSRGR